MNIYIVIRLIIRNIKLLIGFPILMASLMFLLTRNQRGTYGTKATIFTAIASGSSLSNLENGRVDFFASKTAYNNLITILNSRNVIEETSLRLLAEHLILAKPDASILSNESFLKLKESIPDEIRQLVVVANVEKTYQNLKKYMQQDKTNYLYGLINYNHPHYSFKAVSSIKTVQMDGSDIIQLSYQSDDPGVAYHTLKILLNVFLRTYSDLKVNQASAVIGYFEKQLAEASAELNDAEDRLLNFNKSNQIINYYEQTKHISSQQEKIEVKMHDILMEFDAAEAILKKLEEEIQSRFNINLRNREIIDIRESLIVVNKNLAGLGLMDEKSGDYQEAKEKLTNDKMILESRLQEKLDSMYVYDRNSDGIAVETLLEDWLSNVIAFESAKARLLAMKEKSKEFNRLYTQFAPLGAYLKRIEREIEVKEKSYLEILHHLGLARLNQQNEQMQANMKILDPPFLPIDSEPTKRKLMVIVIGVFSFLLVFLGLFAFELLDKTIHTPLRLNSLAGINVEGCLPHIETNNNVNWEELAVKGLKVINEMIIHQVYEKGRQYPLIVQFISPFVGEGKSFTMNKICNMLTGYGFSVSKNTFLEHNEGGWNVITDKDRMGVSYAGLKKSLANYDVVLVEVPALLNKDYFNNTAILKSADLNFFVVNASRTWSNTDNFILRHFREQTGIEFTGILNKSRPDDMIDLIGEIPKKRSRFRSLIKNSFVKKYFALWF